MYIIIDTSAKDVISVGECGSVMEEYAYKNREILRAVQDYIFSKKKIVSDVAGIAVVIGVGSFTATRLAVTLANTWGYVLQIPVLGIFLDDLKYADRVKLSLQNQPVGQYISATYSGMPHIGIAKNSVVQ